MKDRIEASQEEFCWEIWDVIFILVMFVTVLEINYFRVRELLQLVFIVLSAYHIRINLSMVYGFLASRILFLVWAVASFMWALYPSVVLDYMASVIQSTALAMALVIYLTSSEKRLKSAFLIFITTGLLMILYLLSTTSISQIINVNLSSSERITAGSINANQVGVCCSYAVLIVYAYVEKSKAALGWALICIFAFFSIITGSKKALFTLVLGLFFLMIMKSKDAYRCILRCVLFVTIFAVFIWLIFHIHFLYETMGQRLEGLIGYLIDGTGDKSTYSRGSMIIQARKVFLEYPLTGIGLHNFKEINIYGVYAHNNYWELLVCLGIPGFLLYYAPFGWAIIQSVVGFFRLRKKYELTVVLLLCFLVNEYATVSYTNEVIQIILALIISMTSLYAEQGKKYE